MDRDRRPLSSSELARALDCRLVQPDGSRWTVVEVTFQRERTWIRARPAPSEDGNGGADGRLFDIALPPSGRLEWTFPGGWIVRADREEDGDLRWSVEGPDGRLEVDRPRPFFRDAFLGAASEPARRRSPTE